MVIGINGIPVITMELKNEFSGQNVTHAVEQYSKRRESRDPFLKNCLIHFAVDNNTALMTTKLENGNTRFLPFNRLLLLFCFQDVIRKFSQFSL
ncbi:MAG: type I restriction endonuclease [Bacteroidales bacterium]